MALDVRIEPLLVLEDRIVSTVVVDKAVVAELLVSVGVTVVDRLELVRDELGPVPVLVAVRVGVADLLVDKEDNDDSVVLVTLLLLDPGRVPFLM